jgi:hypothetical protein
MPKLQIWSFFGFEFGNPLHMSQFYNWNM